MGMRLSSGPPCVLDEYAIGIAALRGEATYSSRGDKLIAFPKGRKACKLAHLKDRGMEVPPGLTFTALHDALLAKAPPHLRRERPNKIPKSLLTKINRWKQVLADATRKDRAGEGSGQAPSTPAGRVTDLIVGALRGERPLPRDLARVREADPAVAGAVSALLFPFRDEDGSLCRAEIGGLPEEAYRFLGGWPSPTDLRTGDDEYWFSLVYPDRPEAEASEVSIDWDLEEIEEAVLGGAGGTASRAAPSSPEPGGARVEKI
jgi:hypothetical protein